MKKKIMFYLLIFLVAVFAIIVVFTAWLIFDENLRNPVKVLQREYEVKEVAAADEYIIRIGNIERLYKDMMMTAGDEDSIRFTISMPKVMTEESIPLVFIMGGLEIGRNSLKYIPEHGNNILIAYEYPYSPKYWYDGMAIEQIPLIRNAVLSAPAQMAAVITWAAKQKWADPDRINLLGYSFGALFVPSVHHLTQEKGLKIHSTILAYGGTNINQLLNNNLKMKPEWVKSITAYFASKAIWPVDPAWHLPKLQGQFLVINGDHDHQIPKLSSENMRKLTPEPKTIITLNEGHMHPDKPELTAKIIDISRKWLSEMKTVNP
ncbi:MAG: alpha/beta hydrolase family protein [Calditrichaceae bacterium]